MKDEKAVVDNVCWKENKWMKNFHQNKVEKRRNIFYNFFFILITVKLKNENSNATKNLWIGKDYLGCLLNTSTKQRIIIKHFQQLQNQVYFGW